MQKKTIKKKSAAPYPAEKKKPVARGRGQGHRVKSSEQRKATMPTLLTMSEYPPGFSKDGRRLLAKCPEFRLYENYRIGGPRELETKPEIESATWRALFRIKGTHVGPWSEGTRRRVEWAIALKKMMRFKDRGYTGSDAPLASALARAFAPAIEKAISAPDLNEEIDKVSTMFRDAMLALARERGRIKDNRAKRGIAVEVVLIWEAKDAFVQTRKRPRKSYLRKRLESLGFSPSKKKARADWDQWFQRASLDKLPE